MRYSCEPGHPVLVRLLTATDTQIEHLVDHRCDVTGEEIKNREVHAILHTTR